MSLPRSVDYIISGKGLAGACLAIQLLLRNKKIIVFDLPAENHASAVAAGLFNPFTGKVMARTWLADTLFSYLFTFYKEAEKLLDGKFFFPLGLYRPFLSVQEQNGWMGKSADAPFVPYIDKILLEPGINHVKDPYGGLLLKQTGYVDVPLFLDKLKKYLIETDSYVAKKFDESELIIGDNTVTYGEIKATGIIFCEGIGVQRSKFFSWLPINPLKGETIQIQTAPLNFIINRGVYVVPTDTTNEFTVGATYDFTSGSPGTTAEARAELETKLDALINSPYRVMRHNWGIRPTSLDQKIMMGCHPKWKNVLIFNGLGTKGVSQAPYFSAQLAGWLDQKDEILPEVNIRRYKALYSNSE